MISQVSRFGVPSSETLDLFYIVDLKNSGIGGLTLKKERNEDSPLRVRVDAAPGITFGEGGNEEGCTLRGLESRRGAEVDAVLGVELLREFEDIDVFWLHQLFLDT